MLTSPLISFKLCVKKSFQVNKLHTKMFLSKNVENSLNKQLKIELEASHLYLSYASWADKKGLPGIATFFYQHSDEERQHFLKILKYIHKRGGNSILPSIENREVTFQNILPLFQDFQVEEEKVTYHINEIIHECIQNKDYITHDFLQWFAAEQIQEEALVKDILDRLHLIGDDKIGMYTFDRDIMNFRKGSE